MALSKHLPLESRGGCPQIRVFFQPTAMQPDATTDLADDTDFHGSERATAGAAVPHESGRGKLLFGNDTEVRDGFVKMAGFQLLYCTTSLLIRREEMSYSRSFLSKSEK
jgi:hypothetical protein